MGVCLRDKRLWDKWAFSDDWGVGIMGGRNNGLAPMLGYIHKWEGAISACSWFSLYGSANVLYRKSLQKLK